MRVRTRLAHSGKSLLSLCLALLCIGCGTTKSQKVTEQLLMSDAVDRSVGSIDFSVLRGEDVYLDTQHLAPVKLPGFVNSNYIISSLRQQMFAAQVRLVEKREDAKIIVEARVGALGTDGHEISYGLPASNLITAAATIMPNAPPIPTIPELSVARRSDQVGGAKIALFAYERESKQPVWQSGVNTRMSNVRHFWVLGAGPFQRGTIYDGTNFAGSKIRVPLVEKDGTTADEADKVVDYSKEHRFADPSRLKPAPDVELASFEEEVTPRIKRRATDKASQEESSDKPKD